MLLGIVANAGIGYACAAMNIPLRVITVAGAVAVGAVSCERHAWEETKPLHEAHGSHGQGADHAAPQGDGAVADEPPATPAADGVAH